MPINKIYVENFRGINKRKEIDIAPITVIFGANSSGKSTCIHAIACLSQTIKIYNDSRALILDDERAYIHLGQYLDVIHSKNPNDALTLGVQASIGRDDQSVDAEFTFCFIEDQQKVITQKLSYQADGKSSFFAEKSDDGFSIHAVAGSKTRELKIPSIRKFMIEQSQLIGSLVQQRKEKDFPKLFPLINLFERQQSTIVESLNRTLYLGPFRQPPGRRYTDTGSIPSETGSMGEATLALLVNETFREKKSEGTKKISEWLNKLGLGKKLTVNKISAQDIFDLRVTLDDEKDFSVADLGYGLSQVIPVLAQCSFCQEDSTLLFEQPEIHLHPKAMKELADVFIETAYQKGCNIIIETHSSQLIHGFMQAIRNGHLNHKDCLIYKASRQNGETCLQKIQPDAHGETDENYDLGVTS